MGNPENVAMLKKLAGKTICRDISNALGQARALSTDVFGFGEAIPTNEER